MVGEEGGMTQSMLSNGGWIIRRESFDIDFKPAKYGNYVQWQDNRYS
jgi:hypothetical protein